MKPIRSEEDVRLDEELEELLGDDEPVAAGPSGATAPRRSSVSHPPPSAISLMDAPQLEVELSELCRRANVLKEPLKPLTATYRMVGLRLNEFQLRAPRFRPYIQLPRTGQNVDQQEIGRVQRLIDIQWLHCSGYHGEIDDAKFRSLMTGDELGFETAEAFLRERWKSSSRTRMMGLHWFEQVALRSLLSEDVRTAWEEVDSAARNVYRDLREAASASGKQLKGRDVEDFRDLWIAGEILSRNPSGRRPALAEIARLHGWMRGTPPLGIPTISDKRRRLSRWLTP